LTLSASGLDLSAVRYGSGNEPGTLTLRAAGNLSINGSLIDSPAYYYADYTALVSTTAMPSWGFNLVAGARTSSPDLMAVMPAGVAGATGGQLTIAAQAVVYTESGSIRFASAGDTVINQGPQNQYMITDVMNY